jgi:pyruvate dehydrogenase E2 component (dihydrolipoamide acetyltransferase)
MDVKLPQLAEGVESGTVVSILVSEGQEIKKDQSFMELETQKAVGSIPAPAAGVVTKIHVKQGMEVTVGQTLISMDTETTAASPTAVKPSPHSATTASQTQLPPGSHLLAQTAMKSCSAATENYYYE